MDKHLTEIYKTRDLAEAAMLIVKNMPLADFQREGQICWFVFENKEECQKLANQYYFGEILVNARNFHEVMSRLKGRIFSRS